MSATLSGIYPPIPTPFHRDGRLDIDGMRANVERWNSTRLSGYVVLGSNGESVFLSEDEKVNLLRATVAAAAPGKEVIAGTGCESTGATVSLTQAAAEAGAVAALVVNPHFYPLGEVALEEYYVAVADHSSIPILLYNVPKFTGVNLSASLVSRLAAHPNIVGLKDSSGNIGQMSEVIRCSPPDFRVFSGTANVLYAAMTIGCVGGISALANVAPDQVVELLDLVAAGSHDRARDLQMKLLPANIALTATYGVPGLKVAMTLCGYVGGFPRAPLQSLSDSATAELRAILERAGILASSRRTE